MVVVKYSDLSEALDFVSGGTDYEPRAYISKDSGRIYWVSEGDPIAHDVPDDIDESDAYVAIPHKNDLDLGRRLVLRFAEQEVSEEHDTVRDFFGHRGAYRRFKDLLQSTGRLESWYAFEALHTRNAVEAWCEANDIKLMFDEEK